MSIWSKIGKFLSEVSASPGDNVKDLVQAVVTACKSGVSDDQALQILKQAAERQFTPKAQVDLFKMKLRDKGRAVDSKEELSLYVVAIGNSILNLLGEDTTSYTHKSFLTDKDNERMRQSCELQRASINPSSVDQEALRDALWQCFGIKSAWKVIDHPCWEMCRITDLEIWARDEWNRTHSIPSS